MAVHVVNGAQLLCSFGVMPSTLVVLPVNRVLSTQQPAATIMDHVPLLNILPFGMCMSPANPAVVAATSAALGVFTPMPCVPATTMPWAPGCPNVLLNNLPALNNTSTCACLWAGVVSVASPGQMTEMVP